MRAINERPDLELTGVASSQEDVRTHTIDDLLGSDADAIVVCTINSAHAKQVSAALAAGKHVLCEYPLALSHDDAVSLFDQAERLEELRQFRPAVFRALPRTEEDGGRRAEGGKAT